MKKTKKAKKPNHDKLVSYLLQAGLAFVFFYAGVSSLQHPAEWVGYLPHFLAQSSVALSLLKLIAVSEIVLAVWLASGWYVMYSATAATLMLAGIFAADFSQILIVFRDVGLLCAAAALVVLHTSD